VSYQKPTKKTVFPDPTPFCSVSGCPERATKWDGGIESYGSYRNNEGELVRRKLPPQFRCDNHDPHGKWFDLEEKA
jgi:hypothetical protein